MVSLLTAVLILINFTMVFSSSSSPPSMVLSAAISKRNNYFGRRRKSFSTTMIKQQQQNAVSLVSRTNYKSSSSSKEQITQKRNEKTMMTQRQMRIFNLLSGGVAGTVSSILTNPMEVIKTQLQASSSTTAKKTVQSVCETIWKNEGVSGLWRGLAPTLVGIIPSRSVYFYAYQTVSSTLSKSAAATNTDSTSMSEGSPTNALVSGMIAGICSNTLTNPIWMIRTRMQLYGAPCLDSIKSLWNAEGVKGFYKGVSASYWGCTEGALQFVIYEQFKKRIIRRKQQEQNQQSNSNNKNYNNIDLSKWEYFISAALSKGLASILTYPHEVARTRLRELNGGGGMWNCIFTIGKNEGTSGLYAGMGIHLAKVVPNSALMFLTYELVRKWLNNSVQVVDNNNTNKELLVSKSKN